jgi:UPF0755 protein
VSAASNGGTPGSETPRGGGGGKPDKRAKKNDKKKAGKKKGLGVLGVMLVTMTVLAVAGFGALAGGYYWLAMQFESAGPHAEDATIQLAPGSGLNAIAAQLESEGVITNRLVFRAGVTLEQGERSLKAGEYLIPAGASMREVYNQLSEGRVIDYSITFAEGLTSYQIVQIINASDLLTGEVAEVPPEGALLPETYSVTRGTQRQELLERMARHQQELIAELWPNRAEDLPYDTIGEAIIAASIVEKETGRADERGKVAAVVRNRLARPMRLQMDSTIIYGEWLEDQSRPLNIEPLGPELRRPDNPYNTYERDGLPPTPISNPGRDAIAATLNPEPTPEGERPILYFVASCEGDGKHHFTSTLNEHERRRNEWRRCRNSLRETASQ